MQIGVELQRAAPEDIEAFLVGLDLVVEQGRVDQAAAAGVALRVIGEVGAGGAV